LVFSCTARRRKSATSSKPYGRPDPQRRSAFLALLILNAKGPLGSDAPKRAFFRRVLRFPLQASTTAPVGRDLCDPSRGKHRFPPSKVLGDSKGPSFKKVLLRGCRGRRPLPYPSSERRTEPEGIVGVARKSDPFYSRGLSEGGRLFCDR
jgi:hypothetical protein